MGMPGRDPVVLGRIRLHRAAQAVAGQAHVRRECHAEQSVGIGPEVRLAGRSRVARHGVADRHAGGDDARVLAAARDDLGVQVIERGQDHQLGEILVHAVHAQVVVPEYDRLIGGGATAVALPPAGRGRRAAAAEQKHERPCREREACHRAARGTAHLESAGRHAANLLARKSREHCAVGHEVRQRTPPVTPVTCTQAQVTLQSAPLRALTGKQVQHAGYSGFAQQGRRVGDSPRRTPPPCGPITRPSGRCGPTPRPRSCSRITRRSSTASASSKPR